MFCEGIFRVLDFKRQTPQVLNGLNGLQYETKLFFGECSSYNAERFWARLLLSLNMTQKVLDSSRRCSLVGTKVNPRWPAGATNSATIDAKHSTGAE